MILQQRPLLHETTWKKKENTRQNQGLLSKLIEREKNRDMHTHIGPCKKFLPNRWWSQHKFRCQDAKILKTQPYVNATLLN